MLTNARGASAQITHYVAIVTSLRVPDKRGRLGDVVISYSSLGGYHKDTNYLGTIAGHYANHIARGLFTLDGKTYQLAPNHLHGGKVGFNQKL